MIPAKDLRLGNWFRHNNCMCKEEMQLIPDDFKKELVGDSFPQFDPIPITPIILQKSGFHQCMGKIETWWLDDIVIQLDSSFWWRVDIDKYDEDLECKARKVSYLHELQNIFFAVTGQELTVNL